MKKSHTFLLLAAVGLAGYFAYKKYRDAQRAQAHPITLQNDVTLLKTLPVNLNLVSDANIVV